MAINQEEIMADAERGSHPEWFILGKAHSDRARQFKPFAALRGYDELIDAVVAGSLSEDETRSPGSVGSGEHGDDAMIWDTGISGGEDVS